MTTDLTTFILLVVLVMLAVYRAAFMLVHEEGMFGVCSRIRDLAGIRLQTQSELNAFGQQMTVQRYVADNWIGKGLTCFNCTSVWLASIGAIPLTAAAPLPWHPAALYVLLVLAISGAAMRLNGG